jgi:hypothetical protein
MRIFSSPPLSGRVFLAGAGVGEDTGGDEAFAEGAEDEAGSVLSPGAGPLALWRWAGFLEPALGCCWADDRRRQNQKMPTANARKTRPMKTAIRTKVIGDIKDSDKTSANSSLSLSLHFTINGHKQPRYNDLITTSLLS